MPVKLFKVSVKGSVSKDETLEVIKNLVKEEELRIDYEKYMEPALLWATENPQNIARVLDVEKVVPRGAHIMGLFGGEKKSKQKYAGLVVEHYAEHNDVAFIKLVNLDKAYQVPVELMKRHRVGIYKLYYMGLINAFKCETYNALLSAEGNKLKEFLQKMIEINKGVATTHDIQRLETLIRELKVSLDVLKENSYYVVYRRNRAFTACVPEDLERATSSDAVSYLKCKSLEQAYYYVSILNYLAYKVVELGRSFIRHQFARPTVAIVVAGLSWRDVPEGIRREISALAEQLSKKLVWREYSNQKVALRDVAQTQEFERIISVLDGYVDKERLNSALDLVSTTKAVEEESEETEE